MESKEIPVIISLLLLMIFSCSSPTNEQVFTPSGEIDRTILPIKAPIPPTISELDVRNVDLPSRFEVKAPKGAPNVILVLVDDLGFAGTIADQAKFYIVPAVGIKL
jgi:hypothetical protein